MECKGSTSGCAASGILIGVLCGTGAALGWAAGFVAAKHGITVGFSAADLALHRFLWSGLLLMPLVLRDGIADLGGIGWGRGLVMSVLSGPPQAMIAYTGFMLVPLGHGTTIQPACAALVGADPRHAGAGRAADRPAHPRRRDHHRRPAGVRRRIAHHHRQPRRRRRPAVRHRRAVLGDLRHPAAPLARVRHARGGGGRRAVGVGIRAAVRAVRRL